MNYFSIDTEGEQSESHQYVIFQNVMHLQDWADWERPDIAVNTLSIL